MKARTAYLSAVAAAAILFPAAALAQPAFGDGGPPVAGVVVEVENQPVYSRPGAFTSAEICGAFLPADGNLAGVADMFIALARPRIRAAVSGVDLVRYRLQASPNCEVTAFVDRTGLVVRVRLPGNWFETNITTPGLPVVGGLPQGADPRLRVTFDAEVEIRVGLPAAPGGCLRPGSYVARVSNISQPQGVNFTGQITGALFDVASSLADQFADAGIGRRLAGGITLDGQLPQALIDAINQPLCRSGQTFAAFQHSIRGGQLVLALGRGPSIADDRCIDGYVWRQLRPDDRVCVTPATRAQVFADNRLSPSRTQPLAVNGLCPRSRPCPRPAPAPNAQAPCRPDFVWRLAVQDDFACVTPAARDQAASDNRAAPTRRRDYREIVR